MRKRVAEMIQECEVGSTVMEIDGNEETILYARASDVKSVISNHLQQLSNTTQLIQYNNMPSNTMFIQTQADKGGDTTKLCIQSLNRDDVNSVHHLIPVACYEGVYGWHAASYAWNRMCVNYELCLTCMFMFMPSQVSEKITTLLLEYSNLSLINYSHPHPH